MKPSEAHRKTGEQAGRAAAKTSGEAPRKVLVALQSKGDTVAALSVARIVARAFGGALHGVFAWPAPIAPSEVPRLLGLSAEALGGVVLDVVTGDLGERLVAAAEERPGTIVVVPAPAPGTATDPLGLGELGVRALEATHTGVIVVRPGAYVPEHIGRVLLPLDGTPSTASAIGPVGELALEAGAELSIVVVGESGPEAHAADEPGSLPPPLYVDQPQHEWPAYSAEFLERFVQAIGHCPEGVETRLFLGAGDPALEILRFSRQLDVHLAVLVWHGELGEHHGETFRRVLGEATCPVLVLRR
jgi:nucleotide-binding universal stress UspA family protein